MIVTCNGVRDEQGGKGLGKEEDIFEILDSCTGNFDLCHKFSGEFIVEERGRGGI